MIRNRTTARRAAAALTLAGALAACRTAPAPSPAPQVPPSTTPPTTQPAAGQPAAAQPAAPAGPRAIVTPPPLTALGVHRVVPAPESVTPADGRAVRARGDDDDRRADRQRRGGPRRRDARHDAPSGDRLPPPRVGERRRRAARRDRAAARRRRVARRRGVRARRSSADSVRLVAARRRRGSSAACRRCGSCCPPGSRRSRARCAWRRAWTVPAGPHRRPPALRVARRMLDVARHFFTVERGEAVHRPARALQAQHAAPAPVRRPGLAHPDRRVAEARDRRRQHARSAAAPGGFYTKARLRRDRALRAGAVHHRRARDRHAGAHERGDRGVPGARLQPPDARRGARRAGAGGVYTGIRVGWSTFCHDKEATYALRRRRACASSPR